MWDNYSHQLTKNISMLATFNQEIEELGEKLD